MIFLWNFSRIQIATPIILFMGLMQSCVENKKEKESDRSPISERASEAPNQVGSPKVQESMAEGQKVYVKYCLSCHQANGSGVSRLNPPLQGTEYVLGDKDRLLGILINGSNVGLDIDGETYTNAMPAFKHLSDEEVSQIASYIRNSFGNSAAPVSIEEVTDFRLKNDG